MTALDQTTRARSFRFCQAVCCALLLVSTSLTAHVVQAADDTPLTGVQLAVLVDQQRIDREMGAFNSPLLIRMRARVSPTWPGPRGLPLVTERRICPLIPEGVGGLGSDTAPGFC
jgi:hypothetical protein